MADDLFSNDLNDPNYTGDGVDRRRWKFDEGGFKIATDIATMRARQQLREKIRSLHDDIVSIAHPNDFNVTVDGVPIDKAKLSQ
jgi:hypothetical protein